MGFLTDKDARLYRQWFVEMAHLRGIPVLYRYPIKVDPTIHAEMLTEKDNTEITDTIITIDISSIKVNPLFILPPILILS